MNRYVKFLIYFLAPIQIFIFLIPVKISATLIGNPAQPSIQNTGIVRETPSWWDFRLAYYSDYVYSQHFNDEFTINGCKGAPTHLKLWTQAGMLTFNIKNRIDFYGIVGGMRLQLENEVITKQQLAWGVGGKIIFLHEGRFRAGCDIKYFESNQAPSFFQCDNLAYNVVSNFHFNYSEIQAALGLSYRTKYFSPYANASYLIAKLEPKPAIATVRLPMMNMDVDVISKSVTASTRFGLALGATIIDQRKATLSLEWRTFNQNSVDVTGEIRF